jgi:DNA (cytosine-5)-methyltransferase 1
MTEQVGCFAGENVLTVQFSGTTKVNILPLNQNAGGGKSKLTCIEICAGAGGQALGLEMAGFRGLAHVELDSAACATLRLNRPEWHVIEGDVRQFKADAYSGIDLLAGGVPCPPFSKAGKQLGSEDDRDLFPEALRLVAECRPKAVMLENVRGFLDAVFTDYRLSLKKQLSLLGYDASWYLLNASDYGVPQLRPRVVIVAMRHDLVPHFFPPMPLTDGTMPPTVGEALLDLMAANGWEHAVRWASKADEIAPTLVGGSKKHGGADLGPTRARAAWASLGVNGKSLAEEAPHPGFLGMPKLTLRMAARIQGFPDEWQFVGGKTAAYRQVGNAFPPPVAAAVARRIAAAIETASLPEKGRARVV